MVIGSILLLVQYLAGPDAEPLGGFDCSNAIRGVIGGDLADGQSVSGCCRFDRFIDHILKARNGTERRGSKT